MPIVEPPLPPAAPASDQAGFAALLRAHTQDVHREAERSGYIADLLRGRANPAGYALYLFNLLPVYEAMETRLSQSPLPPLLQAFAAPGLARAAALRHDLAALDAGAALSLLPEGAAYVAAIEAASAEVSLAEVSLADDGAALAAHAYARYLGDLSGGQILKPLLARSLELAPEQLTFYDFPDITDVPQAKAAIRAALDQVDPASQAAQIILDASRAAFRHMIALSEALAARARSI